MIIKSIEAKRKKARKLLSEISEFVNDPNNLYGPDLWNILTALRGPDKGHVSGDVKLQTTSKIRYAIGIQAGTAIGVLVGTSLPDPKLTYLEIKSLDPVNADHHFVGHAAMAIQSLINLGYYKEVVK